MHSNVSEIVQRMDEMLVVDEDGNTPGILLLLGLPKTGKDRVLRYWLKREHVSEQQAAVEQVPIVYTEIWRSQLNSLGRKVYVTPMACVVFSELVYALGAIAAQYGPSYARKWYREPKSFYTDI